MLTRQKHGDERMVAALVATGLGVAESNLMEMAFRFLTWDLRRWRRKSSLGGGG